MQDKSLLSGVFGVVLYMWGRIDWLFVLFFVCMAIDYISGTFVAIMKKNWKARKAAAGIWKKVGSIFAISAGAVLDLLIQMLDESISITLFTSEARAVFCTLVLVWYIITEIGSILENAGKLGAPVPDFLKSDVETVMKKIDKKK